MASAAVRHPPPAPPDPDAQAPPCRHPGVRCPARSQLFSVAAECRAWEPGDRRQRVAVAVPPDLLRGCLCVPAFPQATRMLAVNGARAVNGDDRVGRLLHRESSFPLWVGGHKPDQPLGRTDRRDIVASDGQPLLRGAPLAVRRIGLVDSSAPLDNGGHDIDEAHRAISSARMETSRAPAGASVKSTRRVGTSSLRKTSSASGSMRTTALGPGLPRQNCRGVPSLREETSGCGGLVVHRVGDVGDPLAHPPPSRPCPRVPARWLGSWLMSSRREPPRLETPAPSARICA